MTPDPTPYSKALLEAVRPVVEAKAREVMNILAASGVAISDTDPVREFMELCIWQGVAIGTTAAVGMDAAGIYGDWDEGNFMPTTTTVIKPTA